MNDLTCSNSIFSVSYHEIIITVQWTDSIITKLIKGQNYMCQPLNQ